MPPLGTTLLREVLGVHPRSWVPVIGGDDLLVARLTHRSGRYRLGITGGFPHVPYCPPSKPR